ncbi:TROVE domain-containing protein [Streptomyces sp. NBC_01477]|uniref:TROVE domain-containing protein n=1 Tax=Streptomyces sp. NBC_01477 TaxID=2976015 RepID=UPI002E30D52D|nr:TROVE domain-containing protein [Streptomyces sp. NBC_01477]
MSRFNTRTARPSAESPVRSTGERTPTAEGAAGYRRDAKSELFLLAVANFVGTDTFYEKGGDRDDRYTQLVRHLALDDPEWVARMLAWLRGDGNMRTAAIVGAVEYVKARLDDARSYERSRKEQGADVPATALSGDGLPASVTANRRVIASVLKRADEPGELLAYWTSRYGRRIPKPVKRGIEDALGDLYTERGLLKFDTASKGFRFGDVIELVHPAPKAAWQGDLFRHAIDRRHNRDNPVPDSLRLLDARARITRWPVEERREAVRRPDAADLLKDAGMTWEALAGWLQGPMDRAAWEAVIPSMGYMALLRNLRNFDEAGVSDEVAATVAAKLADPGEVARSRQLPMRFYSAFNAAPSLRWGHALEQALTASLGNVPVLGGRTLVMVDTSGSMNGAFSRDGSLMRWDAAALFGLALGRRAASADVVSFSSARLYARDAPGAKTRAFPLTRGGSLLGDVQKWKDGGWFLGGGTDTAAALRKEFAGHDRVVVVTDEQTGADPREVTAAIPATVPMYTWNLAGYEAGHAPSGELDRHAFGGLTDAAFRMIPLLESARTTH